MLSAFIIHSTASSTCLWSSLSENHEFETRPNREAFSFFFRTTVTFIVRVFYIFPSSIQLPTCRQLATYFHELLKIFSDVTLFHYTHKTLHTQLYTLSMLITFTLFTPALTFILTSMSPLLTLSQILKPSTHRNYTCTYTEATHAEDTNN